MGVFASSGQARTFDYRAGDVGYVPFAMGHYIENTGKGNVIFLEMLKAEQFVDVSLNNWLRRVPPEAVAAHLNLDSEQIARIPAEKELVIAG